jgi:hypothetical protein
MVFVVFIKVKVHFPLYTEDIDGISVEVHM